VAALFSLVAAVVTLVAAAETVRGVAALVLLAVVLLVDVLLAVLLLAVVLLPVTAAVLLAAVLPAPFLLAAVLPAPFLLAAVLLVAGRAAVRVLAAVAGLAAAERVAGGLLAVSVVPGMVAVVFVGTDLPPDMDQLRGRHSTESNLLHLMTRKDSDFRDLRSLVVLRQQPADDPQRLFRRRAAADRDPHQIAGQRYRQPHHVMRDLPGQLQQPVLDRLRQHLLHRHPELRANRPKPRPKISHAPRSLRTPADTQRRQRTSRQADASPAVGRIAAAAASNPAAFPTMYFLYVRTSTCTRPAMALLGMRYIVKSPSMTKNRSITSGS